MTRVLVRVASGAVALLLSVALIWDVSREPVDQWTAKLLLAGIGVYQKALSPHLATAGVRCRFEPTCSHYAAAAIKRGGSLEGSWRTVKRLVRCGPWTPAGTVDQP